jgi:glycosyltransferase involved in cell wall biosynthesis
MSVIPLGAPIHPVVSPDESAKTLAKFGITGNFLLFVSRWERYKGLDTLLESFAILRAEFPDLQLVICGKPVATSPDVADLVSVAKAGGLKVITPGFVTDTELSTLYQTASIYVHPSRYEGFGLMILEAFAAGVPVVTSTASCLPEVAGEAALLANPNDSTELAEKISDILSNPELAATLRELGLARAAEYTWAKTAAATHDAYLQTLTH